MEKGVRPDEGAVFKSPTKRPFGQSATGALGWGMRRRRGAGWHFGQKYDERFMNATRRRGVPHRSHGSSSLP
jgi:hypothetical protein